MGLTEKPISGEKSGTPHRRCSQVRNKKLFITPTLNDINIGRRRLEIRFIVLPYVCVMRKSNFFLGSDGRGHDHSPSVLYG
ncbi:unnamed protein product [Penicillium salamii]|nr:unnamed protein product [Penicillium salamii]CAG8157292.1 unnamed protein product [Penicillium salamii]